MDNVTHHSDSLLQLPNVHNCTFNGHDYAPQ